MPHRTAYSLTLAGTTTTYFADLPSACPLFYPCPTISTNQKNVINSNDVVIWSVVINTISGASVTPFQLVMPQTLIGQNRHRIGTTPDTENFHTMDSLTSKFDF